LKENTKRAENMISQENNKRVTKVTKKSNHGLQLFIP